MARALLALALFVGAAAHAQSADTLDFTEVPAQLVIADTVHAALAYGWDHGADTLETAYCVAAHDAWLGGVHVIYLDSIAPPDSMWARNAYRVAFHCPADRVALHTHTDVTCATSLMLDVRAGTCEKGGADAWECEASPSDEMRLTMERKPVALIQCDRNAIVAYYPMHRVALRRVPPTRTAAREPDPPGPSVTMPPEVHVPDGFPGLPSRRP